MPVERFHQVLYRWAGECPFDPEAGEGFWPVGWSFGATAALRLWHRRVGPWLRTDPGGAPEPSLFYAVFGGDAVVIRRDQRPSVANAAAHLMIGSRELLTARFALELWPWDRAGVPHVRALPPMRPDELDAHCEPPEISVHDKAAFQALLPPLSQVLEASGTVTAPAGEETRRVLWMLDEILGVLAAGLPPAALPPLSFDTWDDRPDLADRPGIHLRFRPGLPEAPPPRGTADAARALIETYRRDGANGLRALCHRHGVLEGRTLPERLGLLIRLHPVMPPASVPRPSTPWPSTPRPSARPPSAPRPPAPRPSTVPGATMPSSSKTAPSPASEEDGTGHVSCPICLGRLIWRDLDRYRYDPDQDDYVELGTANGASPELLARERRNTYIRCPNPGGTAGEHYLPANYGRYGPPAVFGLIGASNSGKSHLLASMVGAIERSGLGYGLRAHPIDLARHQRYMRDVVRPLLTQSRRIAPTQENIVQFVDGFVLSGAGDGAGARPMALFDVAGSELAEVEDAKRFLELVDGLIFVADPELWERDALDDVAFSTVLNLLRDSGRLDRVSATVVINKADLLKFEDPIAFWLRDDGETVSAGQALRESADVYAYLHQRGARAWTRPYDEFPRATLHVASALGSASFERAVRPRRVLRPLISLLAMNGLLSDPGVENMGI